MEAGVSSVAAAYLQRLSTRALLGLAGTLCCLAYTWLVVLSWGHIAIDLRLFFLIMSLAWGATLGVYWTQRNTPEPFPRNHMLVWGMLFRVLGVLGQPVLEDDYYRYLWDGRTFAVS